MSELSEADRAAGAAPPRETELNLRLHPDHVGAALAHPLVTAWAVAPLRRRQVVTRYFDTPELGFRLKGLALRLRQDGTARLQSLKGLDDDSGPAGLAVRAEWEWPIEADRPDLTLLPPGLAPASALAGIAEVFVTDLERAQLRLACGDTVIALAADRGVVRADDREQPLAELELELEAGPVGPLFTLAEALAESLPVRLNTVSKADAGYRLIDAPGAAEPARLKAPPLPADIRRGPALALFIRQAVRHVLANEAAVTAGQRTEGVHQARVALRRLRSAFSLFKRQLDLPGLEPLVEETRWAARMLGPARDWDVFIDETLARLAKRLPAEAARVAAAAMPVRVQEDDQAAAHLVSDRLARFLIALVAWTETGAWRALPAADLPLAPAAGAGLERRWRRVLKAGHGIADLAPEARHQLRIQVKKLRYNAELFADLYPAGRVRRFLDRIKAAADVLGRLNDLEVARTRVALLRAEADEEVAVALDRIETALGAERKRRLRKLARLWRGVAEARPFWR